VVQLDAMKNQDGETITVAQGNPTKVWVPLAAPSEGALIARLI
jgi:U32 family peptidase